MWVCRCTCVQVRLRFKKFLKALYKRMVDDHGWPERSSPTEGAEAEAEPAAGPLPGLPDDGLQGISIQALVVSHGAYIRVAVRHFVEELQCSLPHGLRMSQVFSPCPNTGISRFVLTLSHGESGVTLSAVRCVFTNRKDHIRTNEDAD